MIASLTGFLMGFIGSMPIAGPVSLLVFHRGVLGRYGDGWLVGLGGALVEGIYCAVAVHGWHLLHTRLSFLEPAATGMGILLLLTLGLYFICVHQEHPAERLVGAPSASHWASAFSVGATVAALNPSLILSWSASVATLYSITNLTLRGADGIGFAAGAALGILAWFSILLAVLRRFKGRFRFALVHKVVRGVGVGLVAMAIAFAARTWLVL